MNGILAAWTVTAGLLAQAPETPNWHTDYGLALAATKRLERPLLVVIDDPNQPDHRFEQVSARMNRAEAELLSAYELCHIDATTSYGRQVAAAFNVREYPYTAIIDRTGSVILHQQSGQFTSERWAGMLASFKTGVYRAENAETMVRSRGRMCFG